MATLKLTAEQKEANKLARKQAKENARELARIEAEKQQKPIDYITFTIEWKKSRMWGTNPLLTAKIAFKDGTSNTLTSTCSGCGYDKESTVIGDIFNQTLKYKLHNTPTELRSKAPYGIGYYNNWFSFGQGVGVNCYYRIAEFIGGKFECLASGKTFDVYKYTDL